MVTPPTFDVRDVDDRYLADLDRLCPEMGALLLASDRATFVNGAEWFIEGGYVQT